MQQIIWNLPVPLHPSALLRSGPPPTIVQFAGLPSDADHALLGEFLAAQPQATLRLAATDMADDLEFLRHYGRAHRITITLARVTSFEGLRHLRPDLTALGIGGTKKRRVSLQPLRRFETLRELTIIGQQEEIDVVGGLRSLERLCLISVKLPSLDMFRPLRCLRALELKFGGTTNLDAAPDIGRLQYLEILRVNGLSELGVLSRLPHLEYLFLQHLKRVCTLPSLAACAALRRVHLDRVGLTDLRGLADAPQLEELLVLDMPQLSVEDYRPLVGHTRLRAVTAGLRNEARRAQIENLLGLDEVTRYWTDFEFTAPNMTA